MLGVLTLTDSKVAIEVPVSGIDLNLDLIGPNLPDFFTNCGNGFSLTCQNFHFL